MKVSPEFKKSIQTFLTNKAEIDILFKPVYAKPNKNIDDCIIFVLNEVKKTGINAFADAEIFGMCLHYYDEDDIVVGTMPNVKIEVVPEKKTNPRIISDDAEVSLFD